MPIQAQCPDCDASYNLADDQEGKKVRCKKCQTAFTVGDSKPRREEKPAKNGSDRRPLRAPTAKSASGSRRRSDRDRDDDVEDRRPRRREREIKKSGPPMALIIGGSVAAAVLVVGGIIGLAVYANKSNKEDKKDSTEESADLKKPVTTAFSQPQTNKNVGQPNAGPPLAGFPGGNNPSPGVNTPPAGTIIVQQPKVETPVEPDSTATVAAPPSGGGSLNQAVLERVKKSTVLIRTFDEKGGGALGSGFFGIEDGIVLTNAHVMDMLAPESRPPKKIEVVVNSGTPEDFQLSGTVVGVDRDSDLAVLKVFSTKIGQVTIPAPLSVKPAKSLVETQKVYVCGFPLGEELGKEIAIRRSEVASFRKNKEGILDKIQVEGGMTHGNSGGPVVDEHGSVVGVAVSGYDGLNINFAIPGEKVRSFVGGRFDEYNWGQAYYKGKEVVVPVGVSMLDPLAHVKDLNMEVWLGDEGKPRLGSIGTAPASAPADSAHTKFNLEYLKGEGKGEAVFPSIYAGKVWWVQPSWTNAAGQRVWATATIYKPSSPPVERRSATLVFRPKRGNRTLELTTSTSIGLKEKKAKQTVKITSSAKLKETVVVDLSRGSAIGLNYDTFKLGMTVNDQPPPDKSPYKIMFDTLNEYMVKVSSNAFQDARGNIVTDGAMSFPRGLDGSLQLLLSSTHQDVLHTLESLTIPLPNEKMDVGKSWVEWRVLQIDVGKLSESARVRMQYTYLGVCRRNGREEAVVRLEGQVMGAESAADRSAGVWDGVANVDLATGTVVLAKAKVTFDVLGVTREGELVKLAGREDMELKRSGP
jgi:predicted Zn finger-like uncharacterized protein